MDKVVERGDLLSWRPRWRQEGKTVVWTNGCFDLLHVGHVRTLEAARQLGDLLLVGLNSDASVQGLKGPGRPIVPAGERAEILAALSCVDFVVVFDELTPETILAQLEPDIYCKGGEYARPDPRLAAESKVVQAHGGKVVVLPLMPGISTTRLIQQLSSGQERAGDPVPGGLPGGLIKGP